MNKPKTASDLTAAVAAGMIVMALLKQAGIELDEAMIPAIGALVLAILARFGFHLREKKKDK